MRYPEIVNIRSSSSNGNDDDADGVEDKEGGVGTALSPYLAEDVGVPPWRDVTTTLLLRDRGGGGGWSSKKRRTVDNRKMAATTITTKSSSMSAEEMMEKEEEEGTMKSRRRRKRTTLRTACGGRSYRLRSVVYHIGLTPNRGHYTADTYRTDGICSESF